MTKCKHNLTDSNDCSRCGYAPELCYDSNETLGIMNCYQLDKEINNND